jgi:hypothetical protein
MAMAEKIPIDGNVLVALVVLSCSELGIPFVASFDRDFDS